MADGLPCSTLILKEFLATENGGETSHEDHKGFPQETPAGELLRPNVRHLLGRHLDRGRRTWWNLDQQPALRDAIAVDVAGVVRRPRGSWHPVDRPPLR